MKTRTSTLLPALTLTTVAALTCSGLVAPGALAAPASPGAPATATCRVVPDAAALATSRGRNVSSLVPYEGKVFYGYGDYAANTGSSATPKGTNVSWFDPRTAEFGVALPAFRTEEVITLRVLDGKLYVPNIDPSAGAGAFNGFATDASGEWAEIGGDARSIHVFDVTRLGSTIFMAGANQPTVSGDRSQYRAVVYRSDDGGATFTESLVETPEDVAARTGSERVYWVQELNGKVYARAEMGGNPQLRVYDPATDAWGTVEGVGDFGRYLSDGHDMISHRGHLWMLRWGQLVRFDGISTAIVPLDGLGYLANMSVGDDGELYVASMAGAVARVDVEDPKVVRTRREDAVEDARGALAEAEQDVQQGVAATEEKLRTASEEADRVAGEAVATVTRQATTASEQRLAAPRARVRTARAAVDAARTRAQRARQDVARARAKVVAARTVVTLPRRKATRAQRKVVTARVALRSARSSSQRTASRTTLLTARRSLLTARQVVVRAKARLSGQRQDLARARKQLVAAERTLTGATRELASVHQAVAVAERRERTQLAARVAAVRAEAAEAARARVEQVRQELAAEVEEARRRVQQATERLEVAAAGTLQPVAAPKVVRVAQVSAFTLQAVTVADRKVWYVGAYGDATVCSVPLEG